MFGPLNVMLGGFGDVVFGEVDVDELFEHPEVINATIANTETTL
ncbi:MAG: hypothetical protein ACP5US_00660 [Candidatus Kryptoniota bacterium]